MNLRKGDKTSYIDQHGAKRMLINIAVFEICIKSPKVNAPSALAVHKPQASYELPDANQLDIDKLINSVKAAPVRKARNASKGMGTWIKHVII